MIKKAISDIIFEEKLRVHLDFQDYVEANKIRLPENQQEKRRIFIEWYLKEFITYSIERNIKDLSAHFLYISEKRIESILFQKEKS